jgi:hypothetical protein
MLLDCVGVVDLCQSNWQAVPESRQRIWIPKASAWFFSFWMSKAKTITVYSVAERRLSSRNFDPELLE